MRKLFLIITILSSMVSRGQVIKETSKPVTQQKPVKLAPHASEKNATPVAPLNPGPSVVPYYLRAATVVMYTGNDNKEMLSTISITLSRKGEKLNTITNGQPNPDVPLFASSPSQLHKNTEFRINTSNDIVLQSLFTTQNSLHELGIGQIEKNGLRLTIRYSPNFMADAWKLDKVSLVLRVQDANGNSHPALDYKVIRFPKSQLMTNDKRELVCETDGAFLPTP
ncbi:hypothetical protein [Pseudobacter ginsenosidimutans]|uniref:Uncharacterized protein n=1 Tax=Pseudobacter ginsenosidimutans TaxID=661488 RepID=A0A4Q7N441_9BACT|nr:hypothetical protein [Pseudobacter ginsenosidimutans]QEC44303.1 hypothetical protein FSB84_22460 [Pseudobacter ginsenosidimutans]RZS75763.1 hypothetical protein EV199_1636 [Pseudobacter ginsenosidimutans]